MRAAVLHDFGKPLVVQELSIDPPKAGELGIRMAASGVCHSDLHVAQGVHPDLAAGGARPRGRRSGGVGRPGRWPASRREITSC